MVRQPGAGRRRLRGCLGCLALLLSWSVSQSHAEEAAIVHKALDSARAYRAHHEHEILNRFRALLSLPNVSGDLHGEHSDLAGNARWISAFLETRGFAVETVTAGGAPYLIASRATPEAGKTLLIYAHFDGQPVDPAEWASPPFEPVLRDGPVEAGGQLLAWPQSQSPIDPDWRLYARSAGDDKAPIIALGAALDALDAAGIPPSVNLKLILDGEEESGSPSLSGILEKHAQALSADLMLFCDGPLHQSRRRQLVFGVRGSMTVELTAFGPNRPLHSGHYGNWSPNPTEMLIRALASLKDDRGRIRIAGYHDAVRPPTAAELAAIAAMPQIDAALQRELGLGSRLGGEERIERLTLEPAIIVKGFQGGGVGRGSANVIRPTARASLNLRLVPDQQPADALALLRGHLRSEGFTVFADAPDPAALASHANVIQVESQRGYPAYRTALDGPEATRLVRLLDRIDSEPTLLTPTMGGSLPIHEFDRVLALPIVILPLANHDNNQHGANENLRISNLWDAIDVFAVLIAGFRD